MTHEISPSLHGAGTIGGKVHPALGGFWRQLWFWVVLAMIIGIALGAWDPKLAVQMAPLGTGFIKLIMMMIGPLIFCAIISGITRMANMARIGHVALKSIVIFEWMTLGSSAIGLVAMDIFRPGAGMNITVSALNTGALNSYAAATGRMKLVPMLMSIIPNSFVSAFTGGNNLQVVFIAILCGFALIGLGPRGEIVTNLLDGILKMIFRVVQILMWVAPIGAFGAIAFGIGQFGIGSMIPLGKFIVEFYITCLIILVVLTLPITIFARYSLLKFLRYFRDEIVLAIATTSAEILMPRLIEKAEKLGCEDGIAGLVIPVGYTFNSTGACMYMAMVIAFLAQATNIPLSIGDQVGLVLLINITSRSAVGVAGAAFVILIGTMNMFGVVPAASAALVLGIHRLISQAFVPVHAMLNTTAAVGVTRWEGALNMEVMRRELDMTPGSEASQLKQPLF